MDPYRAATLPEEVPPPSRELVYEPNDRDTKRGAMVGWFQLFGGPMLIGVILGSYVGGTTGVLGFVGAVAFGLWYRKKAVTREGSIFRIDGDRLQILSGNGRIEKASFKLHELAGVELDVKTIERLQDGDSPIPALRFANATVAPAVDTARVVLVGTKGRRYTLTQAYLAHMDVTESVGKIRVFLRKNGWLPAGERRKTKKRAEPREESEDARGARLSRHRDG
jgi:hypothetical protein